MKRNPRPAARSLESGALSFLGGGAGGGKLREILLYHKKLIFASKKLPPAFVGTPKKF
ncbi:hypothetical protein JWG44_07840 [Leptospira sp. 201903071]|uniref:hypothetical protein n=1 Tax=Leptospira ainazelensis TaxID=2810034 RepID=UPI0019666E0C|nr:hypothetical protein [Leptospira ainazelensis]MBM9500158.1 hypothetical protein [Leptospira ainazelensis]